MKTVNFLGQDWDEPEWAEWITVDKFGNVEVWQNTPRDQQGVYVASHGEWLHVGVAEAKIIQKI